MQNPPVTPMVPPIEIKPHAISSDLGSPFDFLHNPLPEPDHSALTVLAGGGLSSTLLPDMGVADTHHLVPGALDITLI
jgi:hypothetical protein